MPLYAKMIYYCLHSRYATCELHVVIVCYAAAYAAPILSHASLSFVVAFSMLTSMSRHVHNSTPIYVTRVTARHFHALAAAAAFAA